MSLTESHGDAKVPDKCPPLGTPEYNAFIERQSRGAIIRAMNGHPLLRVGSTVVFLFGGIGGLILAVHGLMIRSWWQAVPGFIVFSVGSIRLLAHLRYSWGPVPDDTQ